MPLPPVFFAWMAVFLVAYSFLTHDRENVVRAASSDSIDRQNLPQAA